MKYISKMIDWAKKTKYVIGVLGASTILLLSQQDAKAKDYNYKHRDSFDGLGKKVLFEDKKKTDLEGYLDLNGLFGNNSESQGNIDLKLVSKVSKDFRSALEFGLSLEDDPIFNTIMGKINFYVANYFRNRRDVVYVEGGVQAFQNKLESEVIRYDQVLEDLFGIKGGVGFENKDFVAALALEINLGSYEVDESGSKTKDVMYKVGSKGNARLKSDCPIDFEAGFEIAYKHLDNVMNELTASFEAGVIAKFDEDFAAEFLGCWSYRNLDHHSSSNIYENRLGVKVKPYARIFKGEDFMILMKGGICAEYAKKEDELTYKALIGISIATK